MTIFKLINFNNVSCKKIFGKWLRGHEIIAQAGCQFDNRFWIIIFMKEFVIFYFAIHNYHKKICWYANQTSLE